MKKIFFMLLFFTTYLYSYNQIGLALSGGGARGFAHIGVLKKLEKHNIIPDKISGTSMGAFIAALYSCGYSADEIEKIVLDINWEYIFSNFKIDKRLFPTEKDLQNNLLFTFNFNLKKIKWISGINNGNKLLLVLKKYLSPYSLYYNNDFNKFPIKLKITATNILNGQPKIFTSGDLANCVRASMAYPGFIAPFEINNSLYFDGFIFNNIPAKIIKDTSTYVIVSDATTPLYEKNRLKTLFDVINQSNNISTLQNKTENLKIADMIFKPKLYDIKSSDFSNIKKNIKLGYESVTDLNLHSNKKTEKLKLDFNVKKININSKINKKYIKNFLFYNQKKNSVKKLSILQDSIFEMFGSGLFEKIDYYLTKVDSNTVNVNLLVKEKKYASLGFGFYYDEYYDFIGHSRLSIYNLDDLGSKIYTTFNIGKIKKIDVNYYLYPFNIIKSSLKINFKYESKFLKFYQNHNLLTTDYSVNKILNITLKKVIKKYYEFSVSSVFKQYNETKIYLKQNIKQLKFNFKYDSTDNFNFPLNGYNLNLIYFDEFNNENNKIFVCSNYLKTFEKKHTLNFKINLGLSNGILHYNEKFFIGGPYEIPGSSRLEYNSSDYWNLQLKYIYKIRDYKTLIKRKLYFSIYGSFSELRENTNFKYENIKKGLGLGFYLFTGLGNLSINIGETNNNNKSFYISYGYKI